MGFYGKWVFSFLQFFFTPGTYVLPRFALRVKKSCSLVTGRRWSRCACRIALRARCCRSCTTVSAMLTRGREAQARASPDTVLAPLPRCFVHRVFLLLPADQRLRCSEVSRAWRSLLANTSLWCCLNLSAHSGIIRFSEALFRAAIAKAGGQLRELNVNGRSRGETTHWMLSTPTLVDALASNAATLKVLQALRPSLATFYTPAEVGLFLEAAPFSLCYLCAVADNVEQARRYVCNEPPYGQLRLHALDVIGDGQLDSLESLEAFCTDLRKHPTIVNIVIRGASLGTAAAMRVIVNAAIALRVMTIGLVYCGCTRACVPELTRLVSAGTLDQMVLYNLDVELFEAGPDTDQFCAAVRASASLNRLEFDRCGLNPDAAAVSAFINARCQ